MRMPRLPRDLQLEDLALEKRTRKVLRKCGFRKHSWKLQDQTIEGLLSLPGLGIGGLHDLLRAIHDYFHPRSATAEPASASAVMHAFLEDELRDLIPPHRGSGSPKTRDRNREIIARYLGLDGQGGNTLREVGDAFGMTRERVRQICSLTVRKLRDSRPATPLLDRTFDLIRPLLPEQAGVLEVHLVAEGVSKDLFRLEGLLRAAELLGRPAPFCLEHTEGKRVAVSSAVGSPWRAILTVARKSIARWGVATVTDVAAQVEQPVDQVVQVLRMRSGFDWLDEAGGWFWLRTIPRNRLRTTIRKILAVAGKIDISELRTGVGRHHRMKGFAPPRRVLLELCRRLPGCRVVEEMVIADPAISATEVLRATERTMFLILKEHGPVLPRAKFEALCCGAGMKKGTFYVYLDYSPIIEKYASGVYGLRGADVTPGTIEALVSHPRRSTKVLLDHGWTPEGKIWISYRLSEPSISSGVFSIPAGLKQFLQGQFPLRALDGFPVGTLVVSDFSAWGLSPFFRRRGGEPGDYLLMVFDLKSRETVVRIGGESLVEELQGGDERVPCSSEGTPSPFPL